MADEQRDDDEYDDTDCNVTRGESWCVFIMVVMVFECLQYEVGCDEISEDCECCVRYDGEGCRPD